MPSKQSEAVRRRWEAAMLGTSAVAVKSALRRARARLEEVDFGSAADLIEPTEPRARELLGQYIAGFEHADIESLEKALRADAGISRITVFGGGAELVARFGCPAAVS